ncbi:hypothetical protein BJV77DRAFT_390368 [Russula vinacea]|nr:hypothetical protein BJV77DRAFT_390368 [Russula vinacea]
MAIERLPVSSTTPLPATQFQQYQPPTQVSSPPQPPKRKARPRSPSPLHPPRVPETLGCRFKSVFPCCRTFSMLSRPRGRHPRYESRLGGKGRARGITRLAIWHFAVVAVQHSSTDPPERPLEERKLVVSVSKEARRPVHQSQSINLFPSFLLEAVPGMTRQTARVLATHRRFTREASEVPCPGEGDEIESASCARADAERSTAM